MNRYVLKFYGATVLAASATVLAGPVGPLTTFQSGTTISSGDMNGNFTAVQTAVDGNAADVVTNAASIATNTADIAALQSPTCPAGMVDMGSFCIDTYEASDANMVTDPSTAGCNADGSGCSASGLVIQSVAAFPPLGNASWLQAAQLCQLAGKRLPTNVEWQLAATGTDTNSGGTPGATGDGCNIASGVIAQTGANPTCVSDAGAFDMVGNVLEWASNTPTPAGLDMRTESMITRGGAADRADAGEYTITGVTANDNTQPAYGFRCALDKI
jgi:formylglycine-generating enzyme required for sulfatase activity